MKKVLHWVIENSISPPRCKYDLSNVVSVITDENNKIYERKPIEFISNDIKLQCSLWTLHGYAPLTCLVYLHSAGMNQFEALNIVPYIVTSDISLFAFDFPGCGLSGGDYLPFDGSGPPHVINCVKHLRSAENITKFCLWGRSMGAAIALQTVSLYSNVFVCVISDSSFCTLGEVLQSILRKKGVPKLLIGIVKKILLKEVTHSYNIDIDYSFPIADAPKAKTPLLMGHGKQDTFVPLKQGEKLFSSYGNLNKQLYIFDAVHFKSRPYFWYEMVARFIYKHIGANTKPRFYEYVYGGSLLHIGEPKEVLRQLHIHSVDSDYEVSDVSSSSSEIVTKSNTNLQSMNKIQTNGTNREINNENCNSKNNDLKGDIENHEDEKKDVNGKEKPINQNKTQKKKTKTVKKRTKKKKTRKTSKENSNSAGSKEDDDDGIEN